MKKKDELILVLCLDNSKWMINGDYTPSNRWMAQHFAVVQHLNCLNNNAIQYTIYIILMAGSKPTIFNILSSKGYTSFSLKNVKLEGTCDILGSLQICKLLFKNKDTPQYIKKLIMFSGSPINSTGDQLVTEGLCNIDNVSLEIISFGDSDRDVLKSLYTASESLENICYFHNIQPGNLLVVPNLMKLGWMDVYKRKYSKKREYKYNNNDNNNNNSEFKLKPILSSSSTGLGGPSSVCRRSVVDVGRVTLPKSKYNIVVGLTIYQKPSTNNSSTSNNGVVESSSSPTISNSPDDNTNKMIDDTETDDEDDDTDTSMDDDSDDDDDKDEKEKEKESTFTSTTSTQPSIVRDIMFLHKTTRILLEFPAGKCELQSNLVLSNSGRGQFSLLKVGVNNFQLQWRNMVNMNAETTLVFNYKEATMYKMITEDDERMIYVKFTNKQNTTYFIWPQYQEEEKDDLYVNTFNSIIHDPVKSEKAAKKTAALSRAVNQSLNNNGGAQLQLASIGGGLNSSSLGSALGAINNSTNYKKELDRLRALSKTIQTAYRSYSNDGSESSSGRDRVERERELLPSTTMSNHKSTSMFRHHSSDGIPIIPTRESTELKRDNNMLIDIVLSTPNIPSVFGVPPTTRPDPFDEQEYGLFLRSQHLTRLAVAYKTGELSRDDFYQHLKMLCGNEANIYLQKSTSRPYLKPKYNSHKFDGESAFEETRMIVMKILGVDKHGLKTLYEQYQQQQKISSTTISTSSKIGETTTTTTILNSNLMSVDSTTIPSSSSASSSSSSTTTSINSLSSSDGGLLLNTSSSLQSDNGSSSSSPATAMSPAFRSVLLEDSTKLSLFKPNPLSSIPIPEPILDIEHSKTSPSSPISHNIDGSTSVSSSNTPSDEHPSSSFETSPVDSINSDHHHHNSSN